MLRRTYCDGLPAMILVWALTNLKIGYFSRLKFVGDASYSIYLFHGLAQGLSVKFFVVIGLTSKLYGVLPLILLLLPILIGSLLHLIIERPVIRVMTQFVGWVENVALKRPETAGKRSLRQQPLAGMVDRKRSVIASIGYSVGDFSYLPTEPATSHRVYLGGSRGSATG